MCATAVNDTHARRKQAEAAAKEEAEEEGEEVAEVGEKKTEQSRLKTRVTRDQVRTKLSVQDEAQMQMKERQRRQ